MTSLIIRFIAQTDTTRGVRACWLWMGAKSDHGYGLIRDRGVLRRATHVALQFDGRPRPEGLEALHECDTPPCVNPLHLSWGTHARNLEQMRERNRSNSGERNGAAKLTRELVEQMRRDRLGGDTYAVLAQRYGVAISSVSRIIRREQWS